MLRISGCRHGLRGRLGAMILLRAAVLPWQRVAARKLSIEHECPPIPEPRAKRLEGKTAVITGGASGIGEAAARLFVAHGAKVVIADVKEDRGRRVAKELGENVAKFVKCDVTKEEEVEATMAAGAKLGQGHLDILYSNAGILGALGPIDELRVLDYTHTLAVNLTGSVLAVKHASHLMKTQKAGGSIVCTGSVSSVVGGIGPHAYSISKAAIAGLVRSTAVELRAHNIRINMVSPDGVSTRLFVEALEALDNIRCTPTLLQQRLHEFSPLQGRCLSVLDVANAALFLASDEAGFLSGHNLMVDCGNSISKPYDRARWFTTTIPMGGEPT